MSAETYTPGDSKNVTDFMSHRSLDSHGQFFVPYLSEGLAVLDCGSGPGSISIGIAKRVAPGKVTGVEINESQVQFATEQAAQRSVTNVSFEVANCYTLPFVSGGFDRVFSHALMEHLQEPSRALSEFRRVLKPGGILGVCSPDWDGFIAAPRSEAVDEALEAYATLQSRNGGNLRIGRLLGDLLTEAGFGEVKMEARYECYPSLSFIGEYLSLQLEKAEMGEHARVLRRWGASSGGLFAQAWVSAVGRVPSDS